MATQLKLKYFGDPILRKVAKPVKKVGPAERFLIRELIRAMYEFEGSGLAAIQVGIEEQIFVADAGQGPFAIINPEVVKKIGKETVLEEGCLSLPGIRIQVKRPETIRVKYLSEFGHVVETELTGLMAKIFQHESDHLFGRMIIDYASGSERLRYKLSLMRLEALSKKPVVRRKKSHA